MTVDYGSAEAQLLAQVRTRGHWEIVIRPRGYKQRIDRSKDLLAIVERSTVDLGGWRFPYLPEAGADLAGGQRQRDEDSQRQLHRFEHHLEVWRFYRSGQFALVTSVGWDWRDQSSWWPVKPGEGWSANSRIGIGHIVQMLHQVFLLAGRLADSRVGDDGMEIEIVLARTNGRELFSDLQLRHLRSGYKADIDRIRLHFPVSRAELLSQTEALTTKAAFEVFGEFGFRPAENVLKDVVSEIRR